MSTGQQAEVTVTVDGRSLGVFDTRTGGGIKADVKTHRPGGMGGLKTYSALPTYDNVEVSRVRELERDHELTRWLDSRAGRAPMTVSEQMLDENGNRWGRPSVWTGRLGDGSPGESNSTNSDPRMYSLTCVVERKA